MIISQGTVLPIYPARSAVGVQWAFSVPTVGHCTCTACSVREVRRTRRTCRTVGTLYCYTVGLQCTLQRTVRPLHFELGTADNTLISRLTPLSFCDTKYRV